MTYPYTTLKNEDQNNSPWVPRALTAVGLGALAFASGTLYRNSNSNNDVVVATTNLVRAVCPFKPRNDFLEKVCICGMYRCEKEFYSCRKDPVCFRNVRKCFSSFPEFQDCADQLDTFAGPGVALQYCLEENCPTMTEKPSASPTSKPTPEPTSKPTPNPTSLPSSAPTVDVCPLDVHHSLKEVCSCAVTHCESEYTDCSNKNGCEKKKIKCFNKDNVDHFRWCANNNLSTSKNPNFFGQQLKKCLKNKCKEEGGYEADEVQ
mmetsp:Transcript_48593/g.49376  ORF Transcript_48593/g.49376 Transcript_48593/m.49376 type:complete len:262 (-) Transcript_48593:220-1005(-)